MSTSSSDHEEEEAGLPSDVSVDGLSDAGEEVIGELQRYMEDDSQVAPSEKTAMMITLCFAYIPDFSTDIHPYNHKAFENNKRQHKPSLPFLKKEIHRRNPTLKGYKNKPLLYLLQMLADDKMKLPTVDMEYLQHFQFEYKTACENKITETTSDVSAATTSASAASSPRITTDDRLRLIEAFLSDEAKTKILATQECLSRQELDARNSVMAVEDYFETVSNVFNDETWVPMLTSLPDLHPDLADARELPLKQYRTTRAKVKEKYNEMKNHLHAMVIKWERSGSGGQQRSDHAEDWGTFDPDLVEDGDDRQNFLPTGNANMYYLLYYWHKLDEEGYLQFTLAKLPDSVKATSDQFTLVSPPEPKRLKLPDRQQEALAASIDALATNLDQRERQQLIERQIANDERRITNEERRIQIELANDERRLKNEERRLQIEEANARSATRLELTGKILQLGREMAAIDDPSNSLYQTLDRAKRMYEQMMETSE